MEQKRFVRIAIVVALVAAAIGTSAAHAVHPRDCEDGYVYRYCGDHVPLSKLPLRFSYDASSAPAIACWNPVATVCSAATNVPLAIRSAMTEWNAAWPGPPVWPGPELPCYPLCLDGGANTISWTSFGENGPVAAADLFYDGVSRISRVDIKLNRDKSWNIAGGAQLATGVASAATAEGLGTRAFGEWYDVESVILHELGHALGLEDLRGAGAQYPEDLTDAGRASQVMYWRYFRGSVKRVLGAGDLAGLHRAALDTYRD